MIFVWVTDRHFFYHPIWASRSDIQYYETWWDKQSLKNIHDCFDIFPTLQCKFSRVIFFNKKNQKLSKSLKCAQVSMVKSVDTHSKNAYSLHPPLTHPTQCRQYISVLESPYFLYFRTFRRYIWFSVSIVPQDCNAVKRFVSKCNENPFQCKDILKKLN